MSEEGAAAGGAAGEGGAGDVEEFVLETAPFDPRFPNQNQTKHCYTSFLDHKRCVKARGEEFAACDYFRRVYTSLCPNAWVAKWEEQIQAGTFPGNI
ncbi:cytochrome c oxidase subunit 6B2 [Folsomia candida]|uniref:cytochrome c oxidase subunit 6B2 n=1 Tax=Folsomia candida TaxID=158441 RepID=UPI000B901CB5|nr:cytochrome c oxidase subunit 6B2 [Folsomia candida]